MQFIPPIAIDKHRFFLFDALDNYIDSLLHRKQQFSAKQQGLEFYVIYAGTIVKNRNTFAKKVKDKNSWRAFGCSKEDLDELIKPIQDYNVAYQWTINNCEIVIRTIEGKWGKATADYIRGCNTSKKYLKAVQKAKNWYNWNKVCNLVTYKVVRRLDLHSKYSILTQLTIDWLNIAPKDIVLTPPTKSINNAIFKRLNILITEP